MQRVGEEEREGTTVNTQVPGKSPEIYYKGLYLDSVTCYYLCNFVNSGLNFL